MPSSRGPRPTRSRAASPPTSRGCTRSPTTGVRDETTRRRASLKRKLAVREAETRLALLRARFERDTRIVSPYAGKVVDLLITAHAPVQMGTTAALLRPARHRARCARGDHLRAGGTGQEDPGGRRRRGRARHRPAARARVYPGRDPLGLRDALHRPVDAGRAQEPRAGLQLHREVPRPGALDHPRRPPRGHLRRPLAAPTPGSTGWTGRRRRGPTSPSPAGRSAPRRSSWSDGP